MLLANMSSDLANQIICILPEIWHKIWKNLHFCSVPHLLFASVAFADSTLQIKT